MTQEEIEELKELMNLCNPYDCLKISYKQDRRLVFLSGKKEEHDKVVKAINYIDQCIKANKFNAKSCGEIPSEMIDDVLKNIKLNILEKLKS